MKRVLITGMAGQDCSGYAPDYVNTTWLMLQSDQPDDYVVVTGELSLYQDKLGCGAL